MKLLTNSLLPACIGSGATESIAGIRREHSVKRVCLGGDGVEGATGISSQLTGHSSLITKMRVILSPKVIGDLLLFDSDQTSPGTCPGFSPARIGHWGSGGAQ